MRQLLIIVIVCLVGNIGLILAKDDRYNYANTENAFYSCGECHNRYNFRDFWSHRGSENLHRSHEVKGAECIFCHHKPKEEVSLE
jgi:cytochrome c553